MRLVSLVFSIIILASACAMGGEEHDMVIVGGGAGALAAAVSAVDAGLSDVVVLDPGDTASLASESVAPAVFAAAETELQRGAGIDDSAGQFADWWMELARGNADGELVEFMARESSDTVSWLQSLGVPFLELGTSFLPASRPFIDRERAHAVDGGYAALYEVLESAALDRGVDVRMQEAVNSLIADDGGRVEGVRVEIDGRERDLFAREAVVLTGTVGVPSDDTVPIDTFLDSPDVLPGSGEGLSDITKLAESVGAAVTRRTGVTAGYTDRRYSQALVGGLDVTETSHVMRKDGSTIPRLYAVGPIAGNRYFDRVRLSPQTFTLTLTQARVVGEHIGRYRRGG
ncbi:MAG: FAD-binding protein [Spirochaetales bacterium]